MGSNQYRIGSARPRRHAIFAWILLAGSAAAQGPNVLYTRYGDSDYDEFGAAVSGAGDVDKDGYADFIVGAHLDDNNGTDSGSARVFSGRTGLPLYTFNGDSAGDEFGGAVGAAGDVNSDGYADVIVGAKYDDDNGTDCGSARVFSGKDGTILYTFYGDAAGDKFGTSVRGAGDVDGDGVDDLIVGAPRVFHNGRSGVGSARVFSGATGQPIYTFYGVKTDDELGTAVNGAGDINGDGHAELIVGAPQDPSNLTGFAQLIDGATGQVLTTVYGDEGGDEMGTAVSGAGDVDGDGVLDFIATASEANKFGDDSGLVRVYSGAGYGVLFTFYGDNAYDYFGKSADGLGDVNGDGHADIVVGAPLDDIVKYDNSGSVFVFSGADGSVLHHWWGDSQQDWLGNSVSGAGNVNVLGAPDLVAGAPYDDDNGPSSGSARVFCGDGPATTLVFGSGCPASNPLTLSYGGSSRLGAGLVLQIGNGPPAGAPCALGFGDAAVPPVDLSGIGMGGCSLYVPVRAVVGVVLNGGSATLGLPIPSAPMLCGGDFFNQAFAIDTGANALGVSATNAGHVTLGY